MLKAVWGYCLGLKNGEVRSPCFGKVTGDKFIQEFANCAKAVI